MDWNHKMKFANRVKLQLSELQIYESILARKYVQKFTELCITFMPQLMFIKFVNMCIVHVLYNLYPIYDGCISNITEQFSETCAVSNYPNFLKSESGPVPIVRIIAVLPYFRSHLSGTRWDGQKSSI